MSKSQWRSVSIPKPLYDEVKTLKPGYMSIAEFVRRSIRYAIRKDIPGLTQVENGPVLEDPVNA